MSSTMLSVYDRQTREKTAVLQNAFDIVEVHELNQIYSLSFSLPSTDEKNTYCLPRHYVRWGDDGELYRIKTPKRSEENTGVITYECEHVITTLCDTVMFGSFQYGGQSVNTRATITALLNLQKEKNWTLAVCDFTRNFEYLWEQENLLNALYSIPKEFAVPYKWSFDTTKYPWRLFLEEIDTNADPEFYLRARSNILSSESEADYANICTRIYPLGYGEGVNQLNIKDATVTNIVRDSSGTAINGTVVENGSTKYGNTYIQSPKAYTDKYGIVEKVMVDRRFENANSLFAYAQSMLALCQEPSMSRSFGVTDLYPLTNYNWDDAEVGKMCKMTQDNTIAYITRTKWQRDKAGDLEIELSTKATDIAQSVADLADRVRIESVYAQGATQLYQHSKDANATPQKGMIMSLYFPQEMRQINKVLMRLKLNRFRSYSKTTESNGGVNETYPITFDAFKCETQETIADKTIKIALGDQYSTGDTVATPNKEMITDGADIAANAQTDEATLTGTTEYSKINGITDKTKVTGNTGAKKVTGNTGAKKVTGNTGAKKVSGNTGNKTISGTTNEGGAISTDTSESGGGSGTTSVATVGDSLISGDLITKPIWANDANYTTTEATPSGFVVVMDGDDLLGETYALYSSIDGYHKHPHFYEHGDNEYIDEGYHSHYVYVRTEHTIKPVFANDWRWTTYGEGQAHVHTITFNALSHSHDINITEDDNFGSHSHSFSVGSHKHTVSFGGHNHTFSEAEPGHNHSFSEPDPGHTHTFSETGNGHTHTFSEAEPGHNHKFEESNNGHTHSLQGIGNHKHFIKLPHTHKITKLPHTHKYSIDHTHTFSCPDHKHTINIPQLDFKLEIKPHDHEIKPGIFESTENPTGFSIYVDNVKKATISKTSYDGDITQWLLGEDNMIPRGKWIDITIVPNKLAYVISTVFIQGFVQSRGGGNY